MSYNNEVTVLKHNKIAKQYSKTYNITLFIYCQLYLIEKNDYTKSATQSN